MSKAAKPFFARIEDLRKHAQLLQESCERFSREHRHDEILNIGVRLRVLVGSGNGSGLLLELANELNEKLTVMALNQYGILRITEIEAATERVVQQVEKKALITQLPGRLPIVFPDNERGMYVKRDLAEWITAGFLLDWDVPDSKGGSKVLRFTPQVLINRYAGQEAAHSDPTYGTFGSPVEAFTMQYNLGDKQLVVPVVYEYLAHVGAVVATVALEFATKYSGAQPFAAGTIGDRP